MRRQRGPPARRIDAPGHQSRINGVATAALAIFFTLRDGPGVNGIAKLPSWTLQYPVGVAGGMAPRVMGDDMTSQSPAYVRESQVGIRR